MGRAEVTSRAVSFRKGRAWTLPLRARRANSEPNTEPGQKIHGARKTNYGVSEVNVHGGQHGDGIIAVERCFHVDSKGLCLRGAGFASIRFEDGCLRGGRYVTIRLGAEQQSGMQRERRVQQRCPASSTAVLPATGSCASSSAIARMRRASACGLTGGEFRKLATTVAQHSPKLHSARQGSPSGAPLRHTATGRTAKSFGNPAGLGRGATCVRFINQCELGCGFIGSRRGAAVGEAAPRRSKRRVR